MSIQDKMTPNQYAKELLARAIDTITDGYWAETEDDMTETEIEKVKAQVEKRAQGLYKYMGIK